jgi:hypothetical protein
MNTSATGGYLVPISTHHEKNDSELADLLQSVVVGLTGLPGTLVRPRWQVDPPNIPDTITPDSNGNTITWAAIGVTDRVGDILASSQHGDSLGEDAGLGQTTIIMNEVLSVLVSFYGAAAERNAQRMRLGFQVSQNREILRQNGFGFVDCGDPKNVPELINQRWLFRVDLPFRVRYQQKYDYAVLDIASVQGTVQGQGLSIPLKVTLETE